MIMYFHLFSPPLPGFGTGIPQRASQAIRAAPIVGRVEKDPPASGNTQRLFQTATRPAAPPQSCCNDKPALFLLLRFPLFLFLPVSKKLRQEGGVALVDGPYGIFLKPVERFRRGDPDPAPLYLDDLIVQIVVSKGRSDLHDEIDEENIRRAIADDRIG